MKILIITNTDQYEDRVEDLKRRFEKSHEVAVLSTDFLHTPKKTRTDTKEGYRFIPTKPYRSNLSFGRLWSHYCFAKEAFRLAEEIKPDMLYVMIPANSLAHFAANYVKRHPETKLVFDLVDLWPESFPLGSFSWFFPFVMWRNLRDRSLSAANVIVAECDLYRTVLQKQLQDKPCVTMHLVGERKVKERKVNLSETEIDLCYLGSVNNIIDIPMIAQTVKAVAALKPVTVHIIGKGERMDEYVEALKTAGAAVKQYGPLYDPAEKQAVFDRCHFGINVMRDTVCVGLTMKSVDYLAGGLPLLNTIKGDTADLVTKYGAGRNLNRDDPDLDAAYITGLTPSDWEALRRGADKAFDELLTDRVFNARFTELERMLPLS